MPLTNNPLSTLDNAASSVVPDSSPDGYAPVDKGSILKRDARAVRAHLFLDGIDKDGFVGAVERGVQEGGRWENQY